MTLPGESLEFDQDIIIPLPFLRKQPDLLRTTTNDHPHDHRNPVGAGSCFVLVHGGWPPWGHGRSEGWSPMAPQINGVFQKGKVKKRGAES